MRPLLPRFRRGRDQFAGRFRPAISGSGQSGQTAPLWPDGGDDVIRRSVATTPTPVAACLPQYAEQYLIRGIGLVRDVEDLRAIVLKEKDGVPVYVRDVAEVQIGHEVRRAR